MPVVAITGATGFLGAHLALEALRRGHRVRAVVRTPARAAWLAARGIEVHRADLADRKALCAAFRGADAVIANAARLSRKGGTSADVFRDNVEGTENQLVAAAEAGVGRVVYVSTIAVYVTRLGACLDERTPLRDPDAPARDLGAVISSPVYARTKAAAERLLWRRGDDLGLAVTSLRPGPIYGAGRSRLNDLYVGWMRRRIALLPTLRFPQVHAGDVAAAALTAIARPESVGRAYNLGGPPASPVEVVRGLVARLGWGPKVVPVPIPWTLACDDRAATRDLGVVFRAAPEHAVDALSPHPAASGTPVAPGASERPPIGG